MLSLAVISAFLGLGTSGIALRDVQISACLRRFPAGKNNGATITFAGVMVIWDPSPADEFEANNSSAKALRKFKFGAQQHHGSGH